MSLEEMSLNPNTKMEDFMVEISKFSFWIIILLSQPFVATDKFFNLQSNYFYMLYFYGCNELVCGTLLKIKKNFIYKLFPIRNTLNSSIY